MNPFISVIVPVYNVEVYLPRCINSLLNQTYTDFELILVDDGSSDSSGAICDEYAVKDNRVRVIHQENKKLSGARNTGLDMAQGEWITIVDSDDWVHKEFLNVLASKADSSVDVILCDCLVTDEESLEDAKLEALSFKRCSIREIERNHLMRSRVWGRLYKKATLKGFRFIPETEPTEDSCFNILLFDQGMVFMVTSAKLYYYYMRPESIIHKNMGRHTLNAVEPMLSCLQNLTDEFRRKRVIERCYKNVWSARYSEMFSPDYATFNQRCNKLLECIENYKDELDWTHRVVCRAFSRHPFLYRAFRIINDPSLLEDEKRKQNR